MAKAPRAPRSRPPCRVCAHATAAELEELAAAAPVSLPVSPDESVAVAVGLVEVCITPVPEGYGLVELPIGKKVEVVGAAIGSVVVVFPTAEDEMTLGVGETLVRVTLFVREVVMTVVESWAETSEAPAARTARSTLEICILRGGFEMCGFCWWWMI